MKQALFENSSDLDMGRRPELKSDEFFVCNPIVIEIIVRRCGLKPLNVRGCAVPTKEQV